jgi:hypothetical protein
LTATVPDAMFADLQSVRIRRREGRKTLIAVRRTKLAPRIVIVRPKTKTKLGERAIVRWKAVDGDTDRGDLRFQVAYSPNNGRAFVPVGVGLSGSSFAFDARQVRRARGTGLLRVFVSDGLNTSFADVRQPALRGSASDDPEGGSPGCRAVAGRVCAVISAR